jgi:hypothetical protein
VTPILLGTLIACVALDWYDRRFGVCLIGCVGRWQWISVRSVDGRRGTELARAKVGTLRLKLFKIAVRVRVSVRRIVLHFSCSYPYQPTLQRIAAIPVRQLGTLLPDRWRSLPTD